MKTPLLPITGLGPMRATRGVAIGLLLAACSPPGPEEAAIRGHLVLEEGQDAAGATVALEPTGRTATADADGKFQIDGLSAGSYDLEVSAPDHGIRRVRDLTVSAGVDVNVGAITLLTDVYFPPSLGTTQLDAGRTYHVSSEVVLVSNAELRTTGESRIVIAPEAQLVLEGRWTSEGDDWVEVTGAETRQESGEVIVASGSGPHDFSAVDFHDLGSGVVIAGDAQTSFDGCRFERIDRVGISSANARPSVTWSEFSDLPVAIELFDADTAHIARNRIEDCTDVGVRLSHADPTIVDNEIIGCAIGIKVQYESNPWIAHNAFEENAVGIWGHSCSPAHRVLPIEANQFDKSEDFDIQLIHNCYPLVSGNNFSTSVNIVYSGPRNAVMDTLGAEDNYWGTPDANRIPRRILDLADDPLRAPILYEPFQLLPLMGTGPR